MPDLFFSLRYKLARYARARFYHPVLSRLWLGPPASRHLGFGAGVLAASAILLSRKRQDGWGFVEGLFP